MKYVLALALILVTTLSFAADKTLKWDPSIGATGYKLYQSNDGGATWGSPVDVGLVTQYTLTEVPDNVMVLWKVSAYNTVGEAITHYQGAWYDGRKKPPNNTVGLGAQ